MKRDRCTYTHHNKRITHDNSTTVSFHVRRSLFIYVGLPDVGLFSYIHTWQYAYTLPAMRAATSISRRTIESTNEAYIYEKRPTSGSLFVYTCLICRLYCTATSICRGTIESTNEAYIYEKRPTSGSLFVYTCLIRRLYCTATSICRGTIESTNEAYIYEKRPTYIYEKRPMYIYDKRHAYIYDKRPTYIYEKRPTYI